MSKELVLKSRIESPDGAYYVYCLRLDVVRKNVMEVHVIAGDHHDFASQPLNSELSEFVSWLKNMEFNGKRDESRTYDLARYFEKHGKNHEWIEHLCGVLRVGDLSGLQYELSQDFEIALGHKDLIMQFDLSEYTPPASGGPGSGGAKQEDLSGLIPLSFVVSPFAGTPLIRLTPGDRVHVRFAKPKDGRSANYLKRMNVPAVDGRYEIDVAVKSLGTRPGKGDVLLKLKLDGGAEGYIIEENQDIRVKMADAGGQSKRGRGTARRESPDLVGGPLALVLLVIAFISVFALLYVFVF
ncbi:MAG: hypothetical protein NXI24_16115 [bacterium]|nr:hypothetical protein [bacterium]